MIEPLFLDDLRAEFERLQARKDNRRRTELKAFHKRLGEMKFFDPACGCGNFLIIAYRELRELEIELIRELRRGRADEAQRVLDTADLSRITVDQFYGIEIGEFPARIAETALWMMDHIMNNRLSLAFGQSYVRIPLEGSPHILNADALETDWTTLLPPEECSYVFGNPPFVGAKFQSEEQRAQVRRIAALGRTGGTLDYVTAWFIRAGEYVRSPTRLGFVATNSITQGEQVAQLWPILFTRANLEISFAHRTFAWGSDARGKAHVHVVIIGLDGLENARADKRLFSYPNINGEPEETFHAALSPYLFDAGGLADPHLTVREESRPINGMGKLITGTQPLEYGKLTFSTNEKAAFIESEPGSAPFFRSFPGAREFIRGECRWILHTADIPPQHLRDLPMLRARLHPVRDHMYVGLPVPVRHDQRLVPLQPQRLQALLRSPQHLLPVRLLLLGPIQRVMAHRLLQLSPGCRRTCQAFQLRGRLGCGCHDPRRTISLLCGQVAGLRPLHPLRALGMVGLPRHPPVVQAVIRHPTERAPRGRHLDDHHSASPASNAATSSPTRSTASRVPGPATAPAFIARAI